MKWTHYREALYTALSATKGVYALVDSLLYAAHRGATIYTCGNGGSAANASHLAQDLSKGTRTRNGPRMRTVCLCDNVSALTAWANDNGYETVFAQQLMTLGRQGDVLLAISGSGNSRNVLEAVAMGHAMEMQTWGICGFDGGKLRDIAHFAIHVPCDNMGLVEAAHGALFHWLVDLLRQRFVYDPNGAKLQCATAWRPGVEQ